MVVLSGFLSLLPGTVFDTQSFRKYSEKEEQREREREDDSLSSHFSLLSASYTGPGTQEGTAPVTLLSTHVSLNKQQIPGGQPHLPQGLTFGSSKPLRVWGA